MTFRITLAKPTRAWPYIALALIVISDDGLRTLLVQDSQWSAGAYVGAIVLIKVTLANFVTDYGFRISMDAWRAKRKREDDARHARFVAQMDQFNAESRERWAAFMRWYDEHGEEWKRGTPP